MDNLLKFKLSNLIYLLPIIIISIGQLTYVIFFGSKYDASIEFRLLFALSFVIFLSTYFLVKFINSSEIVITPKYLKISNIRFFLIIFILIYLIYSYRAINYGLLPIFLSEAAGTNERGIFFDMLRRNYIHGGPYGYFFYQYMIGISIFFAFLLKNDYPKTVALFWLAYVFFDVLSLGRFGIMHAVMFYFYFLFDSNNKIPYLKIIIVSLILFYFIYLISVTRIGNTDINIIGSFLAPSFIPMALGAYSAESFEGYIYLLSLPLSFLMPFLTLFGLSSGELPLAVYGQISSDFSYYSALYQRNFNAYGTFLLHLFIDLRWFMPIGAFFLGILFGLISKILLFEASLSKYSLWLIFFSMYQSYISNPGFSLINFLLIILIINHYFKRRLI